MTEIIIPGRLATPDEIPKMPRQFIKLAEENGWEVKVGYSKFYNPPEVYGNKAQKAGETHGEATVENIWIDAIHRGRRERLTAAWHDGSYSYGKGLGGNLLKSTELRRYIKGEEE